MANNKTKGSNAERLFAKEFREMGFDLCVTSRYGSRMHDDAAIDLIHVPVNVQIKAGKQRGMVPSAVLRDMAERISKMFPDGYPEHDNPNIMVHHRDVGQGKKRDKYDTTVTMAFEDYKMMMTSLIVKKT